MAAIGNRWQQSSLLRGFLIFGLVHKMHCKTIREVRDINSIASFIRSAQDAPSEQHLYRKNKRGDIRERNLVVGGSATPPGRFPYAVSLQSERVLDSSESENNEQVVDSPVCGGTLIASDVVLTAGHCGYNERSSSSSSYVNFGDAPTQIFDGADVGAYDLNENYGGEGYTVDNMLFEKLIIHPEFTGYGHSSTTVGVNNGGSALQHDVMLVKLYGASDNPTVRIHNPNVDAQPKEGEEMVVIGFGDTNPLPGEVNSVMSTVLRAASVAYVPNDLCDNAKGYSNIQSGTGSFEDYFEYDGTITSDMICGLGDNSQDACQVSQSVMCVILVVS
jgi:secreted trypsin-like serine protease